MQWSDVTGVILAAGRGTRMLGLSREFPKPLLPVGNVPLLVGHLVLLRELGVRRAMIVVGHLGPTLMNRLAMDPVPGIEVQFVEQEQALGIAHAVGRLETQVHGPVLVILGDIFFVPERLDGAIDLLAARDDAAVLAVKREPDVDAIRRNFTVDLGDDARVRRVIEKPRVVRSQLKGCGIYLFGLGVFDAIRRTPRTAARDEYEITDSIQIMIDAGADVRAAEVIRDDINLTAPRDLLECNLQHLERHGLDRLIAPNARVHPDAIIRNSVIGEGVEVRAPVEIVDSVLLAGAVAETPLRRVVATRGQILAC